MENDRPFNQQSYEAFLGEERIMGAKCKGCGVVSVPPQPLCRRCRSADLEWVEMPREATLSTFTIITVAPPAMAAQGYGRKNPYATGVVAFDDDCQTTARIEGIDFSNPESVQLGIPMTARFRHTGEGPDRQSVLAFAPA